MSAEQAEREIRPCRLRSTTPTLGFRDPDRAGRDEASNYRKSLSMNPTPPRYEFRTWGHDLNGVREAILRLSDRQESRESRETYIVSAARSDVNPKLREDKLDIKVLVAVRDGFERWEPRVKASFPILGDKLRAELSPLLPQAAAVLTNEEYSAHDLIDAVVDWEGVTAVEVFKRREIVAVGGYIAEFAEVSIEGRWLHTAAVESVDPEALREARRILDLEGHVNVSYPVAIKREIGWTVAPHPA